MVAQPKAPTRKTPAAPNDEDSVAKAETAQESKGQDVDLDIDALGALSDDILDTDAFDSEINTSLDEVLDLLAQEVERLKVALEYYRLSDHPEKENLVRWHVQQIDQRQDRLEDIKSLILAKGGNSVH
jgi:hypothetical protein